MSEEREERTQPQRSTPQRKRRRRRRFSPRFLIMLAVLAALLILMIVLIARCAAKPKEVITAQAFSTGAELQLPLEAKLNQADFASYGGFRFETGKKPANLSKLITRKDNTVTVQSYENAYGLCYLFQRKNDTGVDSWCLYQQDPANTKDWYVFMGAHREVALENHALDILLPLHLIADSAVRDSMGSRLQLDKAYACGAKSLPEGQTLAEAFRLFYEASGLYTVTKLTDTAFSIVPKGGADELTFNFSEGETSGRFLITVPMPEEPEPTAVADVRVWDKDKGAYSDPVTLPEEDALTVSELLINKEYTGSTYTQTPVYQVSLDGEIYDLDCEWDTDTWKVTAYYGGKKAVLTTKGSCIVAAVLAVNNVPGTPERNMEGWPGSITSVVDMPACMVTSSDVNVRSLPATTGKVLMTMPNGSAVAVIGNTGAGWYEVLYNGQRAYMSADYLKTAAS